MSTKERLSKETKMLLGPKDHSEWTKWRAARDKRIREPRRLKTVKDANDERSETASSDGAQNEG